MKKTIRFLVTGLVGAVLTISCASAPKTKEISGVSEIIEHKGTAFGVVQPDWVATVLSTPNQKTLQKALSIDKHIWYALKSGDNLDFVKNWADQIDARAEIGASIKQGISDFVVANMQGEASDVEEVIERYSARASAISVSGLNKETDWWVLSRTDYMKKNNQDPKYTYIVIYSLDEDLYAKQIKKAFADENDKFVDDMIEYLMNYTMFSNSARD